MQPTPRVYVLNCFPSSDLRGSGALLVHHIPPAGKTQMQPRTGVPGTTMLYKAMPAGASRKLRHPEGRRRSHVSEKRERESGQIEKER